MCLFDIFIVSTPSGVIVVRAADLNPPQIYTRLSIMHPEHLHCTAHTQRERCRFLRKLVERKILRKLYEREFNTKFNDLE